MFSPSWEGSCSPPHRAPAPCKCQHHMRDQGTCWPAVGEKSPQTRTWEGASAMSGCRPPRSPWNAKPHPLYQEDPSSSSERCSTAPLSWQPHVHTLGPLPTVYSKHVLKGQRQRAFCPSYISEPKPRQVITGDQGHVPAPPGALKPYLCHSCHVYHRSSRETCSHFVKNLDT